VTNLGQLFISHDGGDAWQKIRREFGGVRSVYWLLVANDVPVLEQRRSSISLTRYEGGVRPSAAHL